MNEIENKKPAIRITDGDSQEIAGVKTQMTHTKLQKLRKPLIFGLMGIVFLGCMYLIFNPSKEVEEVNKLGLNDAVPQATEAGMQSDKQKAYEMEMLEHKNQEERNALTTLSDYWNTDSTQVSIKISQDAEQNSLGNNRENTRNSALDSYRNTQSVLGSFYKNENTETIALRREIEQMKDKLAEKEIPRPTTVDDQLALMEKSYQMAAKYLPQGNFNTHDSTTNTARKNNTDSNEIDNLNRVATLTKNTVSMLNQKVQTEEFWDYLVPKRNYEFHDLGKIAQVSLPGNSIRATVLESQTIVGESFVQLRLSESLMISKQLVPKGTILTAGCRFQNGRLQLKIKAIEIKGNFLPVEINIYDLDGQQGLYVPYSSEFMAMKEIAGNMSQTGGTSIMLTQNAKQQVAADLSRGLLQGISGHFARKVRVPKFRLKAGHQVFLILKQKL